MAERADPNRPVKRCPVCNKPRVERYRPFCSARCRDVDLHRWFSQSYAIPAPDPGDEDEEDDGR